MKVGQQFSHKHEIDEAIERGLAHGLLRSAISFQGAPLLTSTHIRDVISKEIETAWDGPWTGLCQVIVQSCIGAVEDHFSRKAWPTFGWVTDVDRGDIWKMDADKLCNGLKNGGLGFAAEFHSWITLDTGEIIDPTVFRTLAELYPNKFGRGKGVTNMLDQFGRQYKQTPGLPIFQYHPSVFCG